MDDFNEERFKQSIEEALVVTRRVLGTTRNPELASEVGHAYSDKYALVEAQVSSAAVSIVGALQLMGLTGDALGQLTTWAAAAQEVTLTFKSDLSVSLAREAKREVDGPHVITQTTTGLLGGAKSVSTRVTTTVTDYFWSVKSTWSLEAYTGTGRTTADRLLLAKGVGAVEVKTENHKSPPIGNTTNEASVAVTWLLNQLDRSAANFPANFLIDTTHAECHTPRRNADVAKAFLFFENISIWSANAGHHYVLHNLLPAYNRACHDASPTRPGLANPAILISDDIFLPAVFFMDEKGVMDRASLNLVLAEALGALDARRSTVAASLPGEFSGSILTGAEAGLSIAGSYVPRIVRHAIDGVNFVENLLREQLIAAVGKVLQPTDFDAYMRFHARKLFRQDFEPRPFCFAVRRSSLHTPEGTLRIEAPADDPSAPGDPIHTVCATLPASPSRRMTFALSAEASVDFGGDVYLHAWLRSRFSADAGIARTNSTSTPPPTRGLSLLASARQFSSYVLLVGRVASPTSFEPLSAIIVKDKDELVIPLELADLPTPKEFKDAIASLSPEQARFAKAFRAMQLESTLFGIVVLHIKPQLEVLLNLAVDSLTKEVALTQELMDLFIKYQIPSDLLSAPRDGDAGERLTAVKRHVGEMRGMIKGLEDKEIEACKQQERFAHPQVASPHHHHHDMETSSEMPLEDDGNGGEEYKMYKSSSMMMNDAPSQPRSRRMMAAPPMPMKAMISRSAPPMPSMMMRGGSALACAPPPSMSMSMSAPIPMQSTAAVPNAAVAAAPVPPTASASASASVPGSGSGGAREPDSGDSSPSTGGPPRDVTQVPTELDKAYETYDSDSALRATVISAKGVWTRRAREHLLSKTPTTKSLEAAEQATARTAAFDLLDALSRSGALPMAHAAFHVVMGATHTFDESLIDTVVKGNINPIEKVERSLIIMASTLHALPAARLVHGNQLERLANVTPALFSI